MIGVAAEYEALRRHAAVIDRSDRGRVRFRGLKAAEVLNGLVTNDIISLRPGQGAYAAALTAKGKIVADLRVLVFDDSVLTDCAAVAWSGWWDVVRKYVNPRLSAYADERATLHDLGVFGPQAASVVAALTRADAAAVKGLEPYGHLSVDVDGAPVAIARVPDLVPDGFELLADPATIGALHDRAKMSGVVTAGAEAWDIMRVESGRPAWGLDVDESTIPQEANFDELGAISYTKGCYTGQEIVARVHFRGHVNKRLMGLRASTAEPPERGAQLIDADGKTVGDVRSTADSPHHGGIALGMVRREIAAGTELTARWADGECAVQVVPLPLPRIVSVALVTGATGMVGSHIVERLIADGWEVRALVRNRATAAEVERLGATLHQGDVLDAATVTNSARRCDVIFHTAAAITAPGGWEEYRRLNIDGTRHVIAAAEATNARLLHLSSVAVYGTAARYAANGGKTDEHTDTPLASGDSFYARSKRESEDLVLAAHRGGRIWATAVRPDVIYGPRDRQFVPRLGQLLLRGFAPVIGQGRTTLAVVHAANVADGAVLAATNDRAGGQAYNLANDFDVTSQEFFTLAAEGLGRRVRLVRIPRWMAGGAMRAVQWADALVLGGKFSVATASALDFLSRDNPFTSERARLELGWSPRVRPAEGVPAAFRWWRDTMSGRH